MKLKYISTILFFILSKPLLGSNDLDSNRQVSDTIESCQISIYDNEKIDRFLDSMFPRGKMFYITEILILVYKFENNNFNLNENIKKVQNKIKDFEIEDAKIDWNVDNGILLSELLTCFNKQTLKSIYCSSSIPHNTYFNYPELLSLDLNFNFKDKNNLNLYFRDDYFNKINKLNDFILTIRAHTNENVSIIPLDSTIFKTTSSINSIKKIVLIMPSSYLIQNFIEKLPNLTEVYINNHSHISFLKNTHLKIINYNSTLYTPYWYDNICNLKEICNNLPKDIESLSIPGYLSDHSFPSQMLKFSHLRYLEVPYIYNLKNPEFLLNFKNLDSLRFYTDDIKWVNSKRKSILNRQKGDRPTIGDKNFLFEKNSITELIDTLVIKNYIKTICKLNLKYLFLDIEYLFLADYSDIIELKKIPSLIIYNPSNQEIFYTGIYKRDYLKWKQLRLKESGLLPAKFNLIFR